jgi:cell division protein ZapA
MSEFTITVIIADRPYHLKIDRGEEEVVRNAAKSINQLIKEFAETYAYKDKQDLLAMVALNYTTNALNYERLLSEKEKSLIEKLSDVDKVLSEHVK